MAHASLDWGYLFPFGGKEYVEFKYVRLVIIS